MNILIKPLDRPRWHGKVGSESFFQPKIIRAVPDPQTMTYNIELDNEKEKYKDPVNPNIKLTELQYYSKLLRQDLSTQFNYEKPHPFYDGPLGIVKLENSELLLDTNNPLHYMQYKICLSSPIVANSIEEYEEGLFPEATHIIFNEDIEKERKYKIIEGRKAARKVIEKQSKQKRLDLLLLITGRNYKNESPEDIDIAVEDMINNNYAEIINTLEDKSFSFKARIEEGLQRNILVEEKGIITYFGTTVGSNVNEVIEFFEDDENNELKNKFIKQLQ